MKDAVISEKDAVKEMKRIKVDPMGIKIMKDKAVFRNIRLGGIRSPMANIIKEQMLSEGGDAAVHTLVVSCKVVHSDVLLMGTLAQYKKVIEKMKLQPMEGREIAKRIEKFLIP
jgi:dihydropteroate synthase